MKIDILYKNTILACVFLICGLQMTTAQTGINTDSPDASAALHIDSPASNAGVLLPRLSTTERNNIANPANGLMIFNVTNNIFEYNTGTPATPNWAGLGSASVENRSVKYSNTNLGINLNDTSGFFFIPVVGTEEWNDDTSLYEFVDEFRIRVTETARYRVTINIFMSAGATNDLNMIGGVVVNAFVVDGFSSAQISNEGGHRNTAINVIATLELNANDEVGMATSGFGSAGTVTMGFIGSSNITIEKIN